MEICKGLEKPTRMSFDIGGKSSMMNRSVVGLLLLSVFIVASTIVVTELETAVREPQATWEYLVESYEWEVEQHFDVAFYNATEGWVVGKGDVGNEYVDKGHGIIWHTDDGGETWDIVYSRQFDYISHIEIVNPDSIWVATRWGLLHTEDRGQSWQSSYGVSGLATTVEFFDGNYGLASGNHQLFETSDSGGNWTEMESWTFNSSLYEIHFVSRTNIWCCGYDGIFHTMNGGENWVHERDQTAYAMSTINETHAWALSVNLGITHTTNGNSWTSDLVVSQRSWKTDLYKDMEFIDGHKGWLVGSGNPAVAYTPDGGRSWYDQMPMPASLNAVDFVNETHGWAVGWNGVIVRTTNGDLYGKKLITNGPWFSIGFGVMRFPAMVVVINGVAAIVGSALIIVDLMCCKYGKSEDTRIANSGGPNS